MKYFDKLFFVLVIVLSSFTLNAQWQQVPTTGITNYSDVNLITTIGTELYAYINGAGVYKSVDAGANWTIFNNGLPAATVVTSFTTDGVNIYAAATKNGVYSTPIASANWVTTGTGLPTGNNDNYNSLVRMADSLFLGVSGQGVYFKLTTGSAWIKLSTTGFNTSVRCLAVDSIAGVRKLYAGTNSDNGFYKKNANNTFTQINIDLVPANKPRVRSILAMGGYVVVGTDGGRGLVYIGNTTDFNTYIWSNQPTGLPDINVNDINILGTNLYLANGKTVWKSSNISTLPLSWTMIANGFQSVRSNTRNLTVLGTNLWASQNNGGFYTSNAGVNWTLGLKETTPNQIVGFAENAGKLYATTSGGIFESPSANGGDFALFGTGLTGPISQYGLVFGTLGTYATTDGALFKNNAGTWQSVSIDIPGSILNDHPNGGAIAEIAEITNGVNTYLYGSNWSSAGIYRFDGTNWTIYQDTALNANTPSGLVLNNATDTLQRIIGRMPMYHRASNNLFLFHKNRIQVSKDMGNSYVWRIGNYNLSTGTSNIRCAITHSYKGTDYLFIGTDKTYGSAWALGRSILNPDPQDSIALRWTNLTGTLGEVRDLSDYTEDLIFNRIGGSTTSSAINVSKDNGNSWTKFETSINATSRNNVRVLKTIGDYLYVGTTNNEIWRYDLKTAPVFTGGYPKVENIKDDSVDIVINNSRPGTAYYVILKSGETAPADTQIVKGLDANSLPVTLKGSAVIAANTDLRFITGGLMADSTYKVHVVVVSEVIKNTGVQSVAFKTMPPVSSSSVTSIDNDVNVYPNPVSNNLTVQIGASITGKCTVNIVSMTGSIVKSVSVNKTSEVIEESISVNDLTSGNYVVEVSNGTSKTTKTIEKK